MNFLSYAFSFVHLTTCILLLSLLDHMKLLGISYCLHNCKQKNENRWQKSKWICGIEHFTHEVRFRSWANYFFWSNSSLILLWQFAQFEWRIHNTVFVCLMHCILAKNSGSSELFIPDKLFQEYHKIYCCTIFQLQHHRHKTDWSAHPSLLSKPMVMYFFGPFCLFCAKG